MQTEFDENVVDYWRLPNGKKTMKFKKHDGIDGDNDVKSTLPSHLGAFILSNNKRIMIKTSSEINGFCKNNINYGDIDSLYIEKKKWKVLDKAKLVEKELCQGRNDYKALGILYDLFSAPKIKKQFN